ncbi:M14 family metallopeptidase [Candidatus Pacebacteria bacterium]|nr:M14 family metallopeptidase [Candidatus Paceibacterota bacterium]
MKNIIITVLVILILLISGFFLLKGSSESVSLSEDEESSMEDSENSEENNTEDTEVDPTKTVIGTSVEGREITAHHYGNGDDELLFIGGIHAGYSWNTVLVARELMNFLENDEDVIPENIKVTVIPVMNPDGLNKIFGTDGEFGRSDAPSSIEDTVDGRFNANEVDLNRNFDCDWKTESKWQNRTVDGGSVEFSEPESIAVRDYVNNSNPSAIVTWYSAAGGVFASNCFGSVSAETKEITNLYADSAGYKAYEEFDFYEINGDMVNWFAKRDIPAISVLLTNHKDVEWSKNRNGIEALLEYYAKEDGGSDEDEE